MTIVSRRSASASLALGLCVLTMPLQAEAAQMYALVVGVDDYIGEAHDLQGAVNDARDIAASLQRSGVKEIVTLVDAEVTKDALEDNWFRLLNKAERGDTVVFSFAGHGAQEPEPPGRHEEEDGKNENFLLAGFTQEGEGTKQRILDDEVFQWLKVADDRGINVIFIADSCHSGGMSRSARADGVKFRNGNFGSISDDQLEFPPPAIAKLTEADFQLATFVAATSEDRLTPEVVIDGAKRGALSWAFARALEGKADTNGDGVVDQLELLSFLVPAIHAQVESQQTPQVLPLRARSTALFPAAGESEATAGSAEAAEAAEAETESTRLNLLIEGETPAEIADLPFVKIVTEKGSHDIVWVSATGTVEHILGGVVAEKVDASQLLPILSKWAALKLLKPIAGRSPVNAEVKSGSHRYKKGQPIRISVKGALHPSMTLFNLPPDGRVELFIPDPTRPAEANTDWRDKEFAEDFKVDKPPYGAEHLVAIFSDEPLSGLHAALKSMSRAQGAAGLPTVLEQSLAGKDVQVGILDIYTSGAE